MKCDPKVPSALLDAQTWFGRILVRPLRETDSYQFPLYDAETTEEIKERISAGPRLDAAQRIGIYNQQYWFRLFLLLQEAYPTLTRLFGPADFNAAIAEPYLQKYPPCHWSLDCLGVQLPRWAEEEYQESDRSLVLQTSQVDAIYERLRIAQKRPAPKWSDFVNGEFYLQPFVAVVSLGGDLFSFREEFLKQEPEYWLENDFPKIDPKKRDYAVYLQEGEIRREEISLHQKVLLQAFEKGASLSAACNLLSPEMEKEAEPHIKDWFQTWTQRGWFAASLETVDGNL